MTETPAVPKIEFAPNDRPRFRDVPLDFPLLVDGETVDTVTVRRLTAAEVGEMQDAMGVDGFQFERLMAAFTDQPQEVLDALDQDDFAEVSETVLDFLPERMRAELIAAGEQMEAIMQAKIEAATKDANPVLSPPGDGSSPTSPTPSNGTETSS